MEDTKVKLQKEMLKRYALNGQLPQEMPQPSLDDVRNNCKENHTLLWALKVKCYLFIRQCQSDGILKNMINSYFYEMAQDPTICQDVLDCQGKPDVVLLLSHDQLIKFHRDFLEK
jgi:hypothetical protein